MVQFRVACGDNVISNAIHQHVFELQITVDSCCCLVRTLYKLCAMVVRVRTLTTTDRSVVEYCEGPPHYGPSQRQYCEGPDLETLMGLTPVKGRTGQSRVLSERGT
jgi:hypothetical protein